MYVLLKHTKRQVKVFFLFSNILFIVMFVTAVCMLFLIVLPLFSYFDLNFVKNALKGSMA